MICNNCTLSSTTKNDVLNLNIRDKLSQWGCNSLLESENLIQDFHDNVKLFITFVKRLKSIFSEYAFFFSKITLKVVFCLALKVHCVVLHYFSPVR